MTSPPSRSRPHPGVRVAHAVLGGVAAVAWLLLPWVTAPARAAQPEDETATGDLILPLVALGTVVALAVYAFVRRTRRARTRTTPGGGSSPVVPSEELDRQGRRFLVEVDDCARTSAEELGFVVGWLGEAAARPFTEALEDARGELTVAFRLRQGLDDTADQVPADDQREALKQIVARCAEAGRRLDVEAPAFDQLRELEREPTGALEFAEARFRQLTGRATGAEAALGELRERYGPSACLPVAGHVEQAKDRLVFATEQLNRARQATVMGDHGEAAVHLRAAEGAVHQADVFVTGVDRLAAELARAEERLPAVLTEMEAALDKDGLPQDRTAVAAVADVRREVAVVPYDPLDALRRLARAAAALGGSLPVEYVADLLDGALLTARSALTAAIGFVTTHRAAVGSEARTRLAEAERHFALAQETSSLTEARHADRLAHEAQRLAWQDVRSYGNPYGGPFGGGLAGTLLGGVLLGEAPGDRGAPRGPACFGGPATRRRRGTGGPF
ncbi:hypothetical protein [Streptomyces spongiae]|uniref:TPM domain-containing protein n=1 Tax=Streptomyces spongiae TaxID=565072 RepID=A0A5N8XH54_9ACTN|nr:hypothetical protein [Streptomyces spongiae]MPY58843.1 hypothetical protein [Streptomyces spongiae]